MNPGRWTEARRMRWLAAFVLCAPSLACRPLPEAPTELSDLSRYLFRNFESEDEGVREVGMGNLLDFFDDVDLDCDYADRSYAVDSLAEDDLDGIEHPGRDPGLTQPVALAVESAFGPEDHATVIVMADQTPVEPNSPDHYLREFLEPTDPGCFVDRSCMVLRTYNEIDRENLVVQLWHETHKDFRWVELAEPGSGEWGILSRSWLEESAVGDEGNVELRQNYNIDVFLPHDGGLVRYMALYSETFIAGVDDDIIAASARLGIHQVFEATEDYLAGD